MISTDIRSWLMKNKISDENKKKMYDFLLKTYGLFRSCADLLCTKW